ncbi:hypothetical protein SODALDRAFT_380606 [Sodiomyces alkalinus F11]|uniref:Secreted protein n=1 Tax=Sodiomyces alkalinus (strain CBS 110278 / VKM F-3762 / F11) TaxID=1314773 RepID=A0A3N2PPJ0_SODAK|nr:hypothetical protein SODALDRAFT_380606 [Sodiomyces alkalinus F11]ROT36276.1 hypothetical protein SODALDRAFT_380606 [Sodiomyces alkalinus F11]
MLSDARPSRAMPCLDLALGLLLACPCNVTANLQIHHNTARVTTERRTNVDKRRLALPPAERDPENTIRLE